MKRAGVFYLSSCIAILATAEIASAQSAKIVPANEGSASLSDDLHRLKKEVSDLKIEVLQLRIEAEQARLEVLQRESRDADEELRQMAAEELAVGHEMEDLRKQSLEPTLIDQQRSAIATTASEMAGSGAARVRAERLAAEKKGAALRGRVAQAQQIHSQTLARAAALGLTPAVPNAR